MRGCQLAWVGGSLADLHMALLAQFDWPLDNAAAAAYYSSVYLPKTLVRAVEVQQPLLQQLQVKFVQTHQQQFAGFLADLQQTEADIRLFHSYSDVDRTEAYARPPLIL